MGNTGSSSRSTRRRAAAALEGNVTLRALNTEGVMSNILGCLTHRYSPSAPTLERENAMLNSPKSTGVFKKDIDGINSEGQVLYIALSHSVLLKPRLVNKQGTDRANPAIELWPLPRATGKDIIKCGSTSPIWWTPQADTFYSHDSWRVDSGCLFAYTSMKKMPIWSDGVYGIKVENEHETLTGGPKLKGQKSRHACARVLNAEELDGRALADVPDGVLHIYNMLPDGHPGKAFIRHALTLGVGDATNFSVCVCLMGLEAAKLLAQAKFGEEDIIKTMRWIEKASGVAENYVGDLYKLGAAMAHYSFNRLIVPLHDFYVVCEKGDIIYLPGGEDGIGRAYRALSQIRFYDSSLVVVDPPAGVEGPGLLTKVSRVEPPLFNAFGDGVDYLSIWEHTEILREMKRLRWFPVDSICQDVVAVVHRHVVAGDGGTILLAATDGKKVVSISTHKTADLHRWGGEYPSHLTSGQFYERVVNGRAWANTNAPEARGPYFRGNVLSRSHVNSHQKLLSVAMVASGAVSSDELAAANWPTMGGMITAADFQSEAYCTLVTRAMGYIQDEGSNAPVGGLPDPEWRAALHAALLHI